MARKKTEAAAGVQDVVLAPADGAATYRVVYHVKLNGQRFAPGDEITLDLATAARMIECGAVAAAT